MGYRTVIILDNDQQHVWGNDQSLGQKILKAQHGGLDKNFSIGNYGAVVQCVHTDEQTLMLVDSLSATTLSARHWDNRDEENYAQLMLLMAAAEKLGYELVKKGGE